MTRTHSHILATFVVAGATIAATAAPAAAQRTTVRDSRNDVWVAASSDATGGAPSPSTREGDITKAVISYGGDTVRVRLDLVSLRQKGPFAQYAVKLQGKQGRVVREVLVETSRRDRSGSHRVFNARGGLVDNCDASHRVDYRRDRVSVRLDRNCISRPRKVRANVNAARATGRAVFYSDNVHDTAAESAAWSPWVRRSR